ncbi:MAG TPA: GntR family transcriptional regulator [Caulifigura sp.]|jgi:DNA-binding LacI/PurR family transcriptional regulator|nr:GntR family transcriptional regulator [Caulifigura sp.]
MSFAVTKTPRIEVLADEIAKDIRDQRLAPDTPYLTAEQVARQFGVHPRMAHRAMNLLASQDLLVRRRGTGTVIGPAIAAPTAGVIHVLVGSLRYERELSRSLLPGVMIFTIGQELPGTSVQFNILPDVGSAQDAEAALAVSVRSESLRGAVLLGCGRAVQEYVQTLGIPAAVFGGTFATTSSLLSIDGDQAELGRLLATHLVDHGHRRIGVLMHETWLPGDNRYFDAINDVVAAAGGTCVVRSLPLDGDALSAEASQLLDDPAPVTAVICRTQRRLEMFCEAVRALPRNLATRPLEMVFDDTEFRGTIDCAYACLADAMPSQVEIVARRLAEATRSGQRDSVVLPVRLVAPAGR